MNIICYSCAAYYVKILCFLVRKLLGHFFDLNFILCHISSRNWFNICLENFWNILVLIPSDKYYSFEQDSSFEKDSCYSPSLHLNKKQRVENPSPTTELWNRTFPKSCEMSGLVHTVCTPHIIRMLIRTHFLSKQKFR